MKDQHIRIDVRSYSVDANLLDGAPIRIRAIGPGDQSLLQDHFRGLSQRSIYFRFIGFKRDLSAQDLKRLSELDFNDHVGLAATLTENGRERFVGVGRYLRGIGTILLEHLANIARNSGIAELDAEVLSDNQQMLEVFAHSGFKIRHPPEPGVVNLYYSIGKS
jgi:GNAT superfamily N-acetyltransferase